MTVIKKYLSIGLAGVLALVIIYALFIRNERDQAINKLDRANEQINGLIKANLDLKGTIDLLEKQDQQNRSYISDLESAKLELESVANGLELQFKRLKNENKAIGIWADGKLPAGLY